MSIYYIELAKKDDIQPSNQQDETESLTIIKEGIVIEVNKYYAVHYVNKYYIGRVVEETEEDSYEIKFLSKSNSSHYEWPTRYDKESVHKSYIFHGPVTIVGNGPFTVPDEEEIQETFRQVCRSAKKY